ncbi:MAG TPA: CBS domain-containing protein [Bryobacteraceae bacterium]|nr:CBS domain-containing protein [Bryobacteraceae bacterium]
MKVRDVMTKHASFCGPDTDLAAAADLMKQAGCGFLPVVGEGGNVIGVITDRDICIALGTRNRRPSEVRVWDVMSQRLFTCTPEDEVRGVLKTMRAARIRRLPVIDREGVLVGVLSMDDIALQAREYGSSKDVAYRDVEDTYKAICGHAAARAKPWHAAV